MKQFTTQELHDTQLRLEFSFINMRNNPGNLNIGDLMQHIGYLSQLMSAVLQDEIDKREDDENKTRV